MPTNVLAFSDAFRLTDTDIVNLMQAEQGWQNKYRRIMLIGKELPVLDDSLKSDASLVQGCESNVWLAHGWQDNKLKLAASSDAKIVKGLVAIVIAAYNNKTKQEIDRFDIDAYLLSLQLLDELSPTRGNGIKAIVDTIKSL